MHYINLFKYIFRYKLASGYIPEEFFNVLVYINITFAIILTVCYFYQNAYALIGLFTKSRKYKKAQKLHKYAYVICAHDEEKVVGNLVESILLQNYPKELMKVFVIADNCTDHTAEVARNAGAIVYERFSDVKGKSYALDYAIKKLINEYEDEHFEAMFVFDADNLVSSDYTLKMNDLFDVGIKVATSYRESKNFGDSWVSAGASMCFYRECNILHHSRALLRIGTYISGTGYYIDFDIIKKMGGWNYHTLVEDIEFSCDCANHGIKIGYCDDAIFYDEQPIKLRESNIQRLRWCKGTHQCFYKFHIKRDCTFKHHWFTQTKFEMGMHVSPLPIISFTWTIIYIFLTTIYCVVDKKTLAFYIANTIGTIGWLLISLFGIAFIHALIVTIRKHKQIDAPLWKQLLYCFTFPLYAASFLPLSVIALFKKVTWVKVHHTADKKISDMNH